VVTRITYIKVVNGRNRIPRQGMIHEPLKTRSKAIGRAIHAKNRRSVRKPPERLRDNPNCCVAWSILLFSKRSDGRRRSVLALASLHLL
jgi:hypothetical protein